MPRVEEWHPLPYGSSHPSIGLAKCLTQTRRYGLGVAYAITHSVKRPVLVAQDGWAGSQAFKTLAFSSTCHPKMRPAHRR